MNKVFSNRSVRFICRMILFALAVVTGGGVLAVAGDAAPTQIGSEGNEPASKDDIDNGETVVDGKSDRLAPGGQLAGQDLTGTQGSSTQITKGGLMEDEWDSETTKFYPYKVPLLTIMRKISKTIPVSNWIVKHMRIGGETLDGTVTTEIPAAATIKLTPANFSGSLLPFYKGSTVFAPSVPGYKRGSKTEVYGHLMLIVVEKNKNEVTLQAVNGPATTEGADCEILDNMTCPAIPADTLLLCGSTALSESQMLVPPENFQPRAQEVYLQKRGFSIIFTDDYEKIKKKQPLTVADMKADALIKFLLRQERTYWEGIKARFQVETKDGAIEYTYTSEGLINQITNSYAIGNEYTLADLTAINKLQFTDFAENDRAFALCGKNAIERLENIKLGEGRHNVFTSHNEFDLTFKRFTNTYGTIDFTWDQTLDLLGMEDFMVILDLKGARRYVKMAKKEQTNALDKDAYDPREAKRFLHIEADTLALRGYNSILVGPADKIARIGAQGILNAIVSAPSLPDTASKGVKFALTADYTKEDKTYNKGNVYMWNGTSWELYNGQDVAS